MKKNLIIITTLILFIVGICIYSSYAKKKADEKAIDDAVRRYQESQRRSDLFESFIN